MEIKAICSDRRKPYLKVISKKATNAVHILDRFHIMTYFNKAIDKTRREETRKLREDGYEEILTTISHVKLCHCPTETNFLIQ